MPNEVEISKRRLAYTEFKNKQIETDKVKVAEAKLHIDKVFEVTQDYKKNVYLVEVPGILNWIIKYPFLTIKNLMPFSPTGDVNDALFKIPGNAIETKQSIGSISGGSINVSKIKRPNACRLALEIKTTKKHENKPDLTHDYFAKLIERNYFFPTGLAKGTSAWSCILGFIGSELKSEKEIKRRKKLDEDLSIHKKTRQRLSMHFVAEPDTFCKFAERMRQNAVEFEAFCMNDDQNKLEI